MIDFAATEKAIIRIAESMARQEIILWVIAALLVILIIVHWCDCRRK